MRESRCSGLPLSLHFVGEIFDVYHGVSSFCQILRETSRKSIIKIRGQVKKDLAKSVIALRAGFRNLR